MAQADGAASPTARIEQVIADASRIGSCEVQGYRSNPSGLAEATTRASFTAMGAGADRKAIDKAIDTAAERFAAASQAELQRLFGLEDDEALKTEITRWARAEGQECARMAAEPPAVAIILAPPGHDREAGVKAGADDLLQLRNLASWQTPQIIAVGDFLFDLGACRQVLGARKVEAMAAPFVGKTKPDDMTAPREPRYYAISYGLGVKHAKEIGMSRADCTALTPPSKP